MLDPQKIRPPHYFLTLLILTTVLQLICKPDRVVGPAWLGLLPVVAGMAIVVNGKKLFDNHKTPVRHSETPAALVTTGLFKYSRNPMYLGIELFLCGIALMIGTWPFIGLPVVMFLILQGIFIPWEETTMQNLFKERYTSYRKNVRRWL